MKVLIVDDEPTVRLVLEKLLRSRGYDVISAGDGLEALAILRSPDAPQLIILDWQMPGMNGIELCREVRSRSQESYTYIILLTVRNAPEDLLDGFAAGADDYVVKPFDKQELCMRLHAGKRILHLQSQLIATREAFRRQSPRDGATGVWNYAAILDILERELARAGQENSSVGVVLMSIDDFEPIHGAIGQVAGDAALRKVADTIRSVLRPYDSVGRQAGEEFLIVLPGCDERATLECAEQLRSAVGQLSIETDGGPARVTTSVGTAVAGPIIDDVYMLLSDVDEALETARRCGRNRVAQAGVARSGFSLSTAR